MAKPLSAQPPSTGSDGRSSKGKSRKTTPSAEKKEITSKPAKNSNNNAASPSSSRSAAFITEQDRSTLQNLKAQIEQHQADQVQARLGCVVALVNPPSQSN